MENIVIKSSSWQESDLETLFGKEQVKFIEACDMQSLVVELGLYSSKGQAFKAGRKGAIPKGFTDEFKATKKDRLWIWNPKE